jgi:hypothetical protein
MVLQGDNKTDRGFVMSLESNFTISQRADTAIRRAATVVLLVVGISSAILSYAGLRHLAIMAGIPDSLSFLFPIVVDGMILLGSLSVLRAALARMPTWFGWMLTILGTVTSIAGNILSVENANLVSQVIHSVPPIFLCLSLETFIQLLRHRIKNTYGAEYKNPVKENKTPPVQPEIELPFVAAPSVVLQKEAPAQKEAPVRKETPVQEEVVAQSVPALSLTPVVSDLPPAVAEPIQEKTVSVIAPEPAVVAEPVQDIQEAAPTVSKSVESVSAPVAPVAVKKPVPTRPTPARPQPSATPSESVELYRIILENLDDELTKTQRIAEILRVYPDAKIGDLREALGDEPTLRIDGSVRRAKELLKNGK